MGGSREEREGVDDGQKDNFEETKTKTIVERETM